MDLKNTITEMKNTIEGINSRLEYAEEWTSDLEGKEEPCGIGLELEVSV